MTEEQIKYVLNLVSTRHYLNEFKVLLNGQFHDNNFIVDTFTAAMQNKDLRLDLLKIVEDKIEEVNSSLRAL